MKKIWIVAILAWGWPAAAAGPGTTSFDFLNIGVGARQIGMGGVGTSLGDDVNAVFYNPATLGRARSQEASLMYTSWFQSAAYGYLGYMQPTLDWGSFGAQVHYLDLGSLDGFDASGTKTGSFGAHDLLIGGGWGNALLPGFYGGATLNYVRETIDEVSAGSLASDIGALYRYPGEGWLSRLQAGAAARHLGTSARFAHQSESLPTIFDFGVSFKNRPESLALAVEAHQPQADSAFFNLGGEYWMYDALALRMGYDSSQDLGNGFSFGLGIRFQEIQIDYAMGHIGSDLGNTHRVSLIYRFAGVTDKIYHRGIHEMRLGHFSEAILEFDKVLQIDPRYPGAGARLRDAKDELEKQWKREQEDEK